SCCADGMPCPDETDEKPLSTPGGVASGRMKPERRAWLFGAMLLQFAHEFGEARSDLAAAVDRGLQGCARLDELVQALLLLTEAEDQLPRRGDLAILDRRHHVESVLRGEHQHRGDVVDELLEQPRGFGADARPVHAELERRRGGPALAGEQLRI